VFGLLCVDGSATKFAWVPGEASNNGDRRVDNGKQICGSMLEP